MSLGLHLGLYLGQAKASSAAGGFGLDTGLPTPVLSLAVGKTTYPPQFTASFTGGIYTGDQIEFWSASSYSALVTAMASTGSLLNDDDDNGLVNATLSGIASGTTFAACRLRVPSLSAYGATSNIVLHGDATAPTLTSSTTPSAAELQPILYTATFSELVNTPTLSGTDAALLTISGTSPATSYNVVLASGLNLDYEVATGGKTSYSFSIGADDLAANTLSPVAITASVTDVADTPTAFTFTDVTSPAPSTLQISNTITVLGIAPGLVLPGTLSGSGEYNKNSSGWASTTPFTFQLNDTFAVRHTSSSDGSNVSTTLNLNGTSDTFTSGIPALPSSGLILKMEADNLTYLFQNIAGSTAVTAAGQTVGTWKNNLADGFDFAAAADDTTRPTWQQSGGKSWVEFDGTNDILFRAAALGLIASANGCTIVVATQLTGATNGNLIAEGRSGSATDSLYGPTQQNSTTKQDAQITIKNDDSSFPLTSSLQYVNAYPNNTDVVITVTDTKTAVQTYKDGTTDRAATSYSRGTANTVDRTAIGGLRRASSGGFMTGRIYGVWCWNRVLNSTELAQALTYAGLKQGRSL